MEIRGETPLLERSGFSPAPLFLKNFRGGDALNGAGPIPEILEAVASVSGVGKEAD